MAPRGGRPNKRLSKMYIKKKINNNYYTTYYILLSINSNYNGFVTP